MRLEPERPVQNFHLFSHPRVRACFKKCILPNRREIFKESNCIMPISVGQNLPFHEGEKFAATVALVNASFKSCTFVIDDSVQHYSMMIWSKEPERLLYFKALQEGDRWLARNRGICESLSIPFKVLRWNDWVAHPSYLSQSTLIHRQYEENSDYRQAINLAASEYIHRHSKRLESPLNQELALDYCVKYLLEECTVMCLWALEGFDFELYPTGRNAAMKATYEAIIRAAYPNKLTSVSLEFKSRHTALANEEVDAITNLYSAQLGS